MIDYLEDVIANDEVNLINKRSKMAIVLCILFTIGAGFAIFYGVRYASK